MPERGFILTPTYRIAAGVPEVHLHSVLEGGEPAVIIDDRLAPYFFVRAADEAAVRRLAPGVRVVPSDLSTLGGEPVVRVEVALPGDVPGLRTRLGEASVDCLEADLRFAYRYLIDRGIRGAFAVAGGFEGRPGVGRVYRNPTLAPAEFAPRLRVLSLDVETSLDGRRLYSLAMAGAGGERVLMIARREVAGAEAVPDERALLERFLAHVRRVDPDVLTGWNVCDFDLAVLQRACRRAGLRCALGRTDDELDIRRDQNFTRESRAVLCGRVVLDGLALLRSAFIRLEDYRLDTAAKLLIGKRKLFTSEHRGAEIEPRTATIPPASPPTTSRTRVWCWRSWSARGSSSWRSSGASRPGCSSTASARRSRPSTRSTWGRCARAGGSRPRCARRRAPGRASWAGWCSTRAPASTAISSSSTSRACIRASSAPSTSTRSPTCPPPERSRSSARPAAPPSGATSRASSPSWSRAWASRARAPGRRATRSRRRRPRY